MKTRAYVYYGSDNLVWSTLFAQPDNAGNWPKVGDPLTLLGEYDTLDDAKEAVYMEQENCSARQPCGYCGSYDVIESSYDWPRCASCGGC